MTDFGLSKEGLGSKDSVTATFCGTPDYLGVTACSFVALTT